MLKTSNLVKVTYIIFFSLLGSNAVQAATHYECFDKKFNAITMNFVVDGTEVYAAPRQKFEPRKHFNDPTKWWKHLGNGRFKHKKLDGITKCNKTNIKYEKPSKATSKQAISLCFKAIDNDANTVNPKMPKKKKYKILTSGEFIQSQYDSQYGDVVVEVERTSWFLNGLYLAVCQVNLTEYSAYVKVFEPVRDLQHYYYGVSEWYAIKNTNLLAGDQ